MTDQAIQRILTSYDQLAPHIDGMVADFYTRLFKACPEARPLFKHDMTSQRGHLAATLALLIRNIQYQDLLEEAVMDLGAHHVKVGVRPEYYPIVRDALLASIAHALGPAWTPTLHQDWTTLLEHIIAIMLKGATHYSLHAAQSATHPGPQISRPF